MNQTIHVKAGDTTKITISIKIEESASSEVEESTLTEVEESPRVEDEESSNSPPGRIRATRKLDATKGKPPIRREAKGAVLKATPADNYSPSKIWKILKFQPVGIGHVQRTEVKNRAARSVQGYSGLA